MPEGSLGRTGGVTTTSGAADGLACNMERRASTQTPVATKGPKGSVSPGVLTRRTRRFHSELSGNVTVRDHDNSALTGSWPMDFKRSDLLGKKVQDVLRDARVV